MFDGTNIVYRYDGSFEGLLCCVFQSYAQKEMPSNIISSDDGLGLFDLPQWIETDQDKAKRVYESIKTKISYEAQRFVKLSFLTALPLKEMLILRFLRLGYKVGDQIMNMLTEDTVLALQKAVRNLTFESHRFKGFIRFSIYNESLVAVIDPKNYVLPLLAAHFTNRYGKERFMIYDRTHKVALLHQGGTLEMIQVDSLELPEPDERELLFRSLWQGFYDTVAIEDRYNPRCRINFMPKYFWKNLTEFNHKQNANDG